jgi:tetratricopeptide (TPR) repeat protein
LSDLNAAETALQEALDCPDFASFIPLYSETQMLLCHARGQYDSVLYYANLARNSAEAYARIDAYAADALWEQGRLDDANQLFHNALRHAQKHQDAHSVARLQLLMGAFAVQQGQLELGRRRYEQALQHYSRSHSPISCAKLYNNIAVIDHMQHQTQAARDGYSKSLQIRQQQGDQKGEAQLYNNLACLEWEEGNKSNALVLHEQALAVRERLRDQRGIINSLCALVEAYSHFAMLEPAKGRFAELRDLVLGFGVEHLLFYTLHAAACLALAQQEPQLAARLFAHPAQNSASPSECQFNCQPFLWLLEAHPEVVRQTLLETPTAVLQQIHFDTAMLY